MRLQGDVAKILIYLIIAYGGIVVIAYLITLMPAYGVPLLLLAMYVPTIAAITVGYRFKFITFGVIDVTSFLKSFMTYVPIASWVVLTIALTTPFIRPTFYPELQLGLLPSAHISRAVSSFAYELFYAMLVMTPIAPIINAVFALGEEVGWRGFLLTRLAHRFRSWVLASLLVGVIWGLWHSPVILLVGYEYGVRYYYVGIPIFVLNVVAFSFIQTWAFRRYGLWGSSLSHGAINAWAGFYYIFYPVVFTPQLEPPSHASGLLINAVWGPVGIEGAAAAFIVALALYLLDKEAFSYVPNREVLVSV